MPQDYLTSLLTASPRRRGRPRADANEADRIRHIRAAYMRLLCGMTEQEVADANRVSVRTVRRWTKAALAYDDPEAEGLRRLAEQN